MANAPAAAKKKSARHPSAIKRTRRNARREAINRARTSRINTSVKKVEQAIAAGDHAAAMAALKAAQPEIHRGVTKGVLHLSTASRRISRLNARIKGLKKSA
jgi:small subunit ribosomal protein S20